MNKKRIMKDAELEYFDEVEDISSYEHAKRLNELEALKTQDKKKQFLLKIKGPLGKTMIANPRAVRVLKGSITSRLLAFIKNLFTKF